MKLISIQRIIICILFIISVIVGLFCYQDSFITSLSETKSLPRTQQYISILPQSPYRGQFTASYNRLGIVKIRITTGGRLNTNTVQFRLREIGRKTWLVENTYVTDRFIDGEQYPFGFPVIPDSQGKTYEYELSTNDGSRQNTIAVLPGAYAFQSQYIYSTALIRANTQTTLWFLKEKTLELFGSAPHIGYWIMCFLPLVFITDFYVLASVGMIVLFGFLPMQIHSNMVLWIGVVMFGASVFKKNYAAPFVLTLFTLGVCIVTYLFQAYYIASKLATIIPILLTAGGITTLMSLSH